jgi:ABC-2 type transport system permease protein
MGFVADTWHLFRRLVRQTRRMPVFLLLAIVQPILWVGVFGQLFRRVTSIPGFGESNYTQFLAPGIAMMTALFGSVHSGLGLLADMDRGVLDRVLATPVRRGAVIAGRVAHAGAMGVMQVVIILGVAALLGARPHGGAVGIVEVLVTAALLGSGFAAFSNAMALFTRRQEIVIAAMNFILLPSIFLSSMMMSQGLMPSWIRGVARFNPVNWAVTAARDAYEGRAGGELLLSLALLAGFTLACGAVATRAFRKYQDSM